MALGLTEKPRPLGLKANPVIWFDAGDDEHKVRLMATSGYIAPQGNHLCLEVDDLAAMRAHLEGQGVSDEWRSRRSIRGPASWSTTRSATASN